MPILIKAPLPIKAPICSTKPPIILTTKIINAIIPALMVVKMADKAMVTASRARGKRVKTTTAAATP